MAGVKGRSGYHSPRRQAQAQATRRAIAEAARRLFARQGYGAVSLKAVAQEAGVAEQTIYATFGSKPALALALVDMIDRDADVAGARAALEAAAADPGRQLAALVAVDRRLFERGGDVLALLREAGRAEPDLAAAYREGRRRGREVQERVIAAWGPGTLRDGLSAAAAADSYAALSNVESYRVLTEERGWSPERFEQWLLTSLRRLLLA
jgi:AcrR family transcriptional regulator